MSDDHVRRDLAASGASGASEPADAAEAEDAPAADPHPWAEAEDAPAPDPLPAFAAPDRPRGLDAWFPPGGEDEAPPERVADERRMTRLLVLMVALLVGVPTLLTLIAFVAQLVSLRGGG